MILSAVVGGKDHACVNRKPQKISNNPARETAALRMARTTSFEFATSPNLFYWTSTHLKTQPKPPKTNNHLIFNELQIFIPRISFQKNFRTCPSQSTAERSHKCQIMRQNSST